VRPAESQSFTIGQALSTPFASDLVASPQLGRFAWIENQQGRRNLLMARPDGTGKYESKQLTSYNQDDGQEIHGFRLHRHRLDAYKAEADFFQRHVMSSAQANKEPQH
jgi:hypothetical protein